MPSGPACGDCWGTFEDSWCTKFKWDDWCQKCQSDAAFNAEVQKSVDIRTGKTRRPFNDRRVEKITRSGCLVVSRYSLLKDKPFQEVTNGISAKLLQLTEDSVGPEDGNSTQRGVVIKKPGHELPEIIMYSDIFTQTVEVVAPANQILRTRPVSRGRMARPRLAMPPTRARKGMQIPRPRRTLLPAFRKREACKSRSHVLGWVVAAARVGG